MKREQGETKYKTFYSEAAQSEVSYLLYLLTDYNNSPERRYPVVYWLDGVPGRQTACEALAVPLDQAIREGKAPAMIVVGVNGIDLGFYCDSKDGQWPVETVIVKDLIAHIDKTYRTVARRKGRAVE